MSDLRIQSTAPMSIDPDLEDPANAMSRADESAPAGARGRAGYSGYSDGGASSVSTAPDGRESGECLPAALNAVGTCGVAVGAAAGTAGAGAVFTGILCVAATMSLLDCLEGEPASRSQNAR
ncbi:MAG: hypothetical protein M3020_03695 [Myxococcota bacterium]|nr:hypothetical protein [Myxococcota bacterium]